MEGISAVAGEAKARCATRGLYVIDISKQVSRRPDVVRREGFDDDDAMDLHRPNRGMLFAMVRQIASLPNS
jgi:hypothetical protein